MFNFIKKFFASNNIKNYDENERIKKELSLKPIESTLIPKNIKKSTDNEASIPYSSSNIFSISENVNIPKHIISLLWFEDGPLKNFFYNNEEKFNFTYEDLEITITSSFGPEEPSLISIFSSINITSSVTPLDEIGYFPSYRSLTPEEKGIYLKWLTNPLKNSEICIGYVFIFYYGLERFLFLENRIDAFDMIIELRKVYDNSSFQSYSLNSLLSYAFATKSKNLIEKITHTFPNETYYYTKFKIWNKLPLNSDDIISLASKVGFTNKRYIKQEYLLFRENLENILINKFNINFFKLSTYDTTNIEPKNIIFTANYSLRDLKFEVPDLLENNSLKLDLYNLLVETHENTKIQLKENRKKMKK